MVCGAWSGYLLNELDASGQVHTEIDESPVNTFTLIFFLFKNEHVMVKELLQLLICEVDTELLETVELRFLGRVDSGGRVMVLRWRDRGLERKREDEFRINTFSIKSMVDWRSSPKSTHFQAMASL